MVNQKKLVAMQAGVADKAAAAQRRDNKQSAQQPQAQQLRRRRNRRRRRGPRPGKFMPNIPNTTRSGRTPNPMDPRTLSDVLGNTPQGAAWALRVLHPMGEGNDCVARVPDGAATNSVALERRDDWTLSNPMVALDSPPDTWSVVLVQMPVLCRSMIAVCGDPDSMTEDNLQEAFNSYCALTTATVGGALYPAWTMLHNTDNVFLYFTVLKSADIDVDTTDYGPFATFGKQFRRTYLGVTIDFDYNQLTSKGTITSGQFATEREIRVISHSTTTDDVTTLTGTMNVYQVSAIPASTSSITQQDLKSRRAECTTGEYCPLRICQPTIPFINGNDARTLVPDGQTYVDGQLANLWLDGWSTYITRWEGMDKTSSLRIKRKEGLEIIPGQGCVYGPFQSVAPPDDDRARKIVSEFSRTQPHAEAAEYNEKNGMLSNLVGGLGSAIGNLGIPVVSDVGNVVGGIAHTLGSLLGI